MLVITSGDPLSISVEVLAPLLHSMRRRPQWPIVVVGSRWQWLDQVRRLGSAAPEMVPIQGFEEAKPGELHFLDVGRPEDAAPAEQLSAKVRGALAYRALESLSALATTATGTSSAAGRLAVLTAPIDKHACQLAGYPYAGQTEFFEVLWGSPAVMTLAGPRLRVALATNHLALRDVASHIDATLLVRKLTLFARTLRSIFHVERPHIAVCGLNPHAGDQGLFGDEEARHLAPAMATIRQQDPELSLSGPLPADTVFHRAYHGNYDGVLAMYHDQGLAPLKTVHFDDAVNVSGGLPHFRASPDHGPARDLFLRRQASPRSFAAALALATRYLEGGAS